MRRLISISLVCAILLVMGCSKGSTPPSAKALDYKPDFTLQWPGVPKENIQIIPGQGGNDLKIFTASLTISNLDKETGRELHDGTAAIYFLTATEYSPQALASENLTPRAMLTLHLYAFQKDEISRTEILHGENKYLGFEIFSKSKKYFDRKLVIFAGSTLYDVSVRRHQAALLHTPEVDAFFQSFKINSDQSTSKK